MPVYGSAEPCTYRGIGMGTIGILRALIHQIEIDSNPIYLLECRRSAFTFLRTRQIARHIAFVGVVAVPLFLFIGLLRIATQISELPILLNLLIGMAWSLPIVLLAGEGIQRERIAQTWNNVLLTPFTTETILLAKASGGISKIWKSATIFLIGLTTLGAAVLLLLFGILSSTDQDTLLRLLFICAGVAVLIIEHGQEAALCVAMGMAISVLSKSQGLGLVIGVIASMVLRLFQIVFLLLMIAWLYPTVLSTFLWLNIVLGSSLLLTSDAVAASLLSLVGLIIVREGVIRALFQYTLRHAAV